MDLKQYRSKLIGSDDERAVSPVIGVILMVAITVILAAVIAAFVLDMGGSQSQSAQAGISFDESDETVTVSITSMDRADSLRVEASGDCGDGEVTPDDSFSSVGDTVEVTCDEDSSGTGTVQVIGTYGGSENVISTYDYEA